MKSVIVTGAAGFVGYHLTKTLSDDGYTVYAIVRAESQHNERISKLPGVHLIYADLVTVKAEDFSVKLIGKCDYFFNLVWMSADRYDYVGQMDSAYLALRMVNLASKLGCRKYVGIGSQAEYGETLEVMFEDNENIRPFCGYGSAKVAACCLTRKMALELGMEWVWGRIFSVYGKYEPETRLVPSLINALKIGEEIYLSSGKQNWDYLNGEDAARAIIAIGEKGIDGEIYNIANGAYKPLKGFIEEIRCICRSNSIVNYGSDSVPFVSLQPSVSKIKRDTGWVPSISFADGIRMIVEDSNV